MDVRGFRRALPLRQLCTEILDCPHSTPTWTDQGVVVLRNQNIRDGRLDISAPSYTNEATFLLRTHRALPAHEDLVITREAPMGEVCMIPTGLRCCLGQRMVLLRPNRETVEPRYLLYAIQSSAVQSAVRIQGGTGSTVSNLRIPVLAALEIPLPSTKAEQEAIAEALSDADALIESLEQLVAKKRQVKQGVMQELLTGEKRLPGFKIKGGYKQTEVGVIPMDWNVTCAIDACSKIQDGTHFSPRMEGGDYLYITSKNIKFGYLDISTASRIDAEQHQAIYRRCDVKKGDLLITKDGANTGNAALNTLDEELSLLSSVAFLRFSQGQHCTAYFLQQVLSPQGQRQIQDAMAGNAITRLTLEKIKKLRFPSPPRRQSKKP